MRENNKEGVYSFAQLNKGLSVQKACETVQGNTNKHRGDD